MHKDKLFPGATQQERAQIRRIPGRRSGNISQTFFLTLILALGGKTRHCVFDLPNYLTSPVLISWVRMDDPPDGLCPQTIFRWNDKTRHLSSLASPNTLPGAFASGLSHTFAKSEELLICKTLASVGRPVESLPCVISMKLIPVAKHDNPSNEV